MNARWIEIKRKRESVDVVLRIRMRTVMESLIVTIETVAASDKALTASFLQ